MLKPVVKANANATTGIMFGKKKIKRKTFAKGILFCKKYEQIKDKGNEINIVIKAKPNEFKIINELLLSQGIPVSFLAIPFKLKILTNISLKLFNVNSPLTSWKAKIMDLIFTKDHVITNCKTGYRSMMKTKR